MPKTVQSGKKQVVVFSDKEYKNKFWAHAHIIATNEAKELADALSERYNRVNIIDMKDAVKVIADQQKGYPQ